MKVGDICPENGIICTNRKLLTGDIRKIDYFANIPETTKVTRYLISSYLCCGFKSGVEDRA